MKYVQFIQGRGFRAIEHIDDYYGHAVNIMDLYLGSEFGDSEDGSPPSE